MSDQSSNLDTQKKPYLVVYTRYGSLFTYLDPAVEYTEDELFDMAVNVIGLDYKVQYD